MLVDSHCHLDRLDLDKAGATLDEMLSAARARGVGRFLSVATDLASSRTLLELAAAYEDVFVSAGVHPLQDQAVAEPAIEELLALGSHEKVVAIGETGLDNYYSRDTAHWQHKSFITHLNAASELQKPVIVHTREARDETLDLIRHHLKGDAGGVLHCFTETWEMAEEALAMGFYISFSGIITFRNAAPLREVVKKVPLDRILVETDCPWLAPMPYRGKQNEPRFVVEVAQMVAQLKGVSEEQVACQTTSNFNQLFGLN